MILTKALSGIARSGATRAGYPVLQGAKVPLYALSNVARSGATRSNYVGSRIFINIGGIDLGSGAVSAGVGVLAESLTKSDAINNTPVTLAFTARGWVPVEGSDVVVTLGSKNNGRREFGGTILSTRHRYVGDKPVAANMLYDVSCIDYTWGLDRRKVSGNYTNASVAAIAASLLTFAPGYTLRVEPDIGAEILDQITFTEQGLSSAFAQLAKRVGGDFLCDFAKVVHLFYENTALAPPTIVNAVHPSLANISFTRDLSQVATRVLGNFGGSNALDAIKPGDIFLPVETAAWYLPQGGTVLVGQQRVTYGGVDTGGGGSLVGPGAAPTGTPNVTLQPGAGVDIGTHDYAVTFKTVSGESIPGPRVTVPVGVFLPPPTAPTAGAPVAPSSPLAEPTAVLAPGAGLGNGSYQYAYSFTSAAGESVPSPPSAPITAGTVNVGFIPNPTTAPTWTYGETNGYLTPQTDYYISVTFLNAKGETASGPSVYYRSNGDPSGFPQANDINLANIPVGPAGTTGKRMYLYTPPKPQTNNRHMLWKQDVANSTTAIQNFAKAGVIFVDYIPAPSTNTTGTPTVYNQATVTGIATGPSGTTGRKVYRTAANGAQLKLLTTLPNNVVTALAANDTTPDASLGANAPTDASGPDIGTHDYAVSFVITGGETTPGPRLTVSTGLTPPPTTGPTAGGYGSGPGPDPGSHDYAVSFVSATGETPAGPIGSGITTTSGMQTIFLSAIPTGSSGSGVTSRKLYRRSAGAGLRFVAIIAGNSTTTYTDIKPNADLGVAPPVTNTATLRQIPLSAIPVGNSMVVARNLYRTVANASGSTLKLLASVFDNTTTTYLDTVTDAALGAAALTVSTAQAAQVALSAIPLGAAGVTARMIYRTKAGLTPLLLRATLADNTTTTYLDVLPDSTLGAAAPVSDTSGLQQPNGNVFAGSPTLICASVAGFRPTGGWAIVGSQNIRYTALSGNALLGIPASGPGAITATINYNTTAVAAAMLTGIPTTGLGVIKYTVLKGDPVNIFVQVDDLAAQAAVRAQLPGSDGIIEDEIQDGRLGYVEGVSRCQARLDLLAELDSDGKVGVITVTYVCRDTNTIAGATATINLGPPINLRGDFLIQRVGVNQFHVPHLNPTYTVEASSIRFSAEEMLRLLRQGAM
jgi:hypothetical protein